MTKRIWTGLAMVFAMAACARGGDAPMSPVVEKFAADITFYVDYDDGDGAPVIAMGAANVHRTEGEPRPAPGILGLGTTGGVYFYGNEGNVDLTVPGTLIVWSAGWKRVENDYVWPVIFTGSRGAHHPVGRLPISSGSAIYVHFCGRDGAPPDQQYAWIDYDTWGDGWHMLALTWDAGSIGLSFDGGMPAEKSLSEPLDTDVSWIVAGGGGAVVDEFAILNRKLTADELKWLYEETLKRSASARP